MKAGEKALKRVVQLFRNKATTKTRLTIKANDGTIDEITSTPGHKYYLPDNNQNRNANECLEHASYEGLSDKWVSACDLKKGDRVLFASADSLTGKPKYGIVIEVKTEECAEFTTYNFEVEDFHTYYVGENGVCVHNACNVDEVYKPVSDGTHRAVINPGETEVPHAHIFKKSENIGRIFSNGKADPSLITNRQAMKFVNNNYSEIMNLISKFYGIR